MGSPQFLIFYLCCAVLSTYAHGYFNADSQVPVIGASGAIAGVIGAYAVRFPTARITLLVPIIIIPLIFTVPAVVFAVVWFGIQVLQGAWETLSPSMGGGIAWWAHIGGFVAGLVLLPIFLLFAPPPPDANGGLDRGTILTERIPCSRIIVCEPGRPSSQRGDAEHDDRRHRT